jgi:hypothetical protein
MPEERNANVREAERFEDSPIAWFGELILAKDRGDFRRATEAQNELSRLGWSVKFRKARPSKGGAE